MKKYIVTFTGGIQPMFVNSSSYDKVYQMIEKTTHPAIGFVIQEIPKQGQPQQQEHRQSQ